MREGERTIYFDHAATTPLDGEVFEKMRPYYTENFGNADSPHSFGRAAMRAVDAARDRVAELVGAKPDEIYFTSGGTESDNWAILGAAYAQRKKGKTRVIVSSIEHHAALSAAERLEKEGFSVAYLPVNARGEAETEALRALLTPETGLVAVMAANNETGVVQPFKALAKLAHENGSLFFTDAVQAAGHVKIDVNAMHIDLLSLSAHKFHGPKGVGMLYARRGIILTNLIEGGAQERGKRGGTENVPGIAAMAAALTEACANMDENTKKVTALRDKLIDGISKIPHCALNGAREPRLPGNVNFCFEGIEGESLLLLLDAKGISASSGSACTSGSLDPSHVLLAIGRPHEVAHGSLRLTICEDNTEEEIDYILAELPPIVDDLRNMSPVWKDLMSGKRQFTL